MKKEVIEELNDFVIRVLKGGEEVHPQETAVLPEVLNILKSLPDSEDSAEKRSYSQSSNS